MLDPPLPMSLPGTPLHGCPTLMCPPSPLLPTQVPEDFGPVRTVAEGRGDTIYVGTTRNCILQGSVHTGFSLLIQVSSLFCTCLPPCPTISLLFPLWFFLTSLFPWPGKHHLPSLYLLLLHNPTPDLRPLPKLPMIQQPTGEPLAQQRVPRTPLRLCCPALLIRVVSFSGGMCQGRLSHRLHIPQATYLPGLQVQGSRKARWSLSVFLLAAQMPTPPSWGAQTLPHPLNPASRQVV